MALSHRSTWRDDNLLSVDRAKAVDALLRGREVANRLRDLLGKRKFGSGGDGVPAEDLVAQILNSFGTTLSMLNPPAAHSESDYDEVSQVPVAAASEYSAGDSCKGSENLRERKVCYKKRRTDNTYTKVTIDLIDDGYAWRKYGQKSILNNDFPRNYFRCTHKHDSPGCQASKQVQQISKDPPMFRTTYINHHTCKNYLKPPQIIFDPTPMDSSTMLCFQTSTVLGRQDHGTDNNNTTNNLFSSTTCFASTSTATHENAEENRSDNTNNQSSSSDYHYMTSLPDFEGQLSENANSCTTTSSHGFEFDNVNDLKFVVDESGYYHYQ